MNPSKNERLIVLSDLMQILVSPEQTGNSYAIIENIVPPLAGPPPHTHPDEEVFYVLEGEFDFILHDPENPQRANAGSVIHVPSMALHTFKNVGDKPGKLLVILTPGSLIDYFRGIASPYDPENLSDMNQIPDFAKMDLSKVFALAPEFKVSYVLPDVH